MLLVSQSESSVENSPEVSRKPSVQEVSGAHSRKYCSQGLVFSDGPAAVFIFRNLKFHNQDKVGSFVIRLDSY